MKCRINLDAELVLLECVADGLDMSYAYEQRLGTRIEGAILVGSFC